MIIEKPRILIVKYSSLGDVINAVPAIKFLRRSRPGLELYWVLKKEYSPLFADCRFIDEIVEFHGTDFKSVRALAKKIRSLKIDVVVDLQGILKSAVIGYLSGAGIRVCFPYTREASSLFYTKKVGVKRGECHSVEENLSVIEEFFGKKALGPHDFHIELSTDTRERSRALIESNGPGTGASGPVVVINPVTRWASKMWSAESFAALATLLVRKLGARVFFTGLPGDFKYIEGIRAKTSVATVNLAGKTDIRTLAGVIEESDLVVSCDSGPMHMAVAFGRPVVALFGPTNPDYTGPFGKTAEVITVNAECAPCRKRTCDDMRCMDGITPEMVMEGVRKLRVGENIRELVN